MNEAASHSAMEPSASPPAMTPSGCAAPAPPPPASDAEEEELPAVPQAREAKRSGAEAPAEEEEDAGRRSGESEARSTAKTFFINSFLFFIVSFF